MQVLGKESILVLRVSKRHRPALSGQSREFRILSREKENEQTGCYIKVAWENPQAGFTEGQKQAVLEAICTVRPGLPPLSLGKSERYTFNSLTQSEIVSPQSCASAPP